MRLVARTRIESGMVRRILFAVIACIVVSGVLFWFIMIEPSHRHLVFCGNVRAELELLAKKRPRHITKKQWEQVVAWTLNGHANCFAPASNMPPVEMARFEKELKLRLTKSNVDLETIDWIWDSYVRFGYLGKQYSDNYRPTTPERLKEYEEGNPTHWGIEVD